MLAHCQFTRAARVRLLGGALAAALLVPASMAVAADSLFTGRVLTDGLSDPAALAMGPDGRLWVAERGSAEITAIDPATGTQQLLLAIGDAAGGLLDLVLHPELGQGTGHDAVYVTLATANGARMVRYPYDPVSGAFGLPETVSDAPVVAPTTVVNGANGAVYMATATDNGTVMVLSYAGEVGDLGVAEAAPADVPVTSDAYTAAGAGLYDSKCAACHGAEGQGGIAPALAVNANLGRDGYVEDVLVHGFGNMPAFGSAMDDVQVAQVATYIRNLWGNAYGLVTAEDVAQVR